MSNLFTASLSQRLGVTIKVEKPDGLSLHFYENATNTHIVVNHREMGNLLQILESIEEFLTKGKHNNSNVQFIAEQKVAIVCPHCGHVLTRTATFDSIEPPNNGDLSICCSCEQPSYFQDGKLILPTPGQLQALLESETYKDALRHLRQMSFPRKNDPSKN